MTKQMFADAEGQHAGVERQVVLPFAKSVEIAYRSIRVRFFRSLITILSLVLAVSFLSFTDVSNDIANGMLASRVPEWRQDLVRAGYDVAPQTVNVSGSPKQRWIIFLSLLVCTVGIVNAQLMAVTERFREIGTMKCLGALDRFVLRLFILEAGMQGACRRGRGRARRRLRGPARGLGAFRGRGGRSGPGRGRAAVSRRGHRGRHRAQPGGGDVPGVGRVAHAARGGHARRAMRRDVARSPISALRIAAPNCGVLKRTPRSRGAPPGSRASGTPRGQGISRDGEPVLNLNFRISNLKLVSRHA